jgi:Flp pilus assembly pilin Flp
MDSNKNTTPRPSRARSLLRDQRGAEMIEKLVAIALFVFVAAVGLKYLGDATSEKLKAQGTAIEGAQDQLPAK